MNLTRLRTVFSCLLATIAVTGGAWGQADPDLKGFRSLVVPFLHDHCVKCHGPDKQKAEVRVDDLTPIDGRTSGDLWKHIAEQIELQDMPPEDEKQPSLAKREEVSAWIRAEIGRAEKVAASTGGKVVLRRLNRSEYGETIRRLLHLHQSIDPSENLPEDAAHDGFDNVGSVMTTSSRLLEMYLETAEQMLDIALPVGPKQESKVKRLEGEAVTQEWIDEFVRRKAQTEEMYKELRKLDRSTDAFTRMEGRIRRLLGEHYDKLPRQDALQFGRDDVGLVGDSEGLVVRQGVTLKTQRFSFSTREAGVYRVTGRVRGVPGKDGTYPTAAVSFETTFDTIDLWSMQLTDKPVEFSVESYVHDPIIFVQLFVIDAPRRGSLDDPGMWVDFLQIEGPVEASPTPAYQAIFGESPAESDAPRILQRFAFQAFRRPVKPERMEQFLSFYRERREAGVNFEMAIRDTLTAILVAPEFLFLLEPKQPGASLQPLDDYELASRLSYFLWSGPPDAELIAIADSGKLTEPDVLRGQVARMIQHERAGRFAQNFAGQWLRLRELGRFEPDPRTYPEYNRHLEAAMRRETELFFLHILRENLPIRTLIDSDFTYLNRDLAQLYGIEGVNGAQNEFVQLPAGSTRGGLLSHSSILTLTSDGVRTSPVKRGTYILEQLLGDPPPPPPPDVPPVPEVRGSTLKERLMSHRQLEACAGCHNKIDPIGFALENFNAIGKRRDIEAESRKPIDPSGEWIGAGEFSGYQEFLTLMLNREEDLERSLAEKMLVYALGRPIDFADDPVLEEILETVRADERKLATLVTEMVTSKLFLSK